MSKPIHNRGTASQTTRMAKRLTQLRSQLDQAQASLKQTRRQEQGQTILLVDGLNRLERLEEQILEQRNQTGLLMVQAPAQWTRANYTYLLNCISADMDAWIAQIASILTRLHLPGPVEPED